MDDRDLEERLSRRLHARFDAGRPSETLRDAVSRSLKAETFGARPSRFATISSTGRLLLAAAAVVVVAAAVLFARGPGLLGPGSATPTPSAGPPASASASPSASPTPSASASASPAPSVALSVPPGPWTSLRVTRLAGAPVGLQSVVPWTGGYVAVAASDSGGGSTWTSTDGRTWTELPASMLGLDDPSGNTVFEAGAPCADRVLAFVIAGATASPVMWSSSDGATWTSKALDGQWNGRLAGGGNGAIMPAETGPMLDVTTDCATWRTVTLPGPAQTVVTDVAAFQGGFVAVGFSGTYGGPADEPLAWSSPDGTHWSAASVQARTGEGFETVQAGSAGLTATSDQPGVTPGIVSLWTSPDGRTWTPSTADPLGVIASGEGSGSIAGVPYGDGTHLLIYGGQGGSGPVEYWTSLDGTHWTKLALTGSDAAALAADPSAQAFLMQDGLLFSASATDWYGTAVGP